jgi:hypothetical protein
MVGVLRLRFTREHSSLVFYNGLRIDSSCHRPTSINLRHDLMNIIAQLSEFGHSRIRRDFNLGALASHASKRIKGATGIDGRTPRVHLVTKALGRVSRACQVELTRVVGDKASVLDELKVDM